MPKLYPRSPVNGIARTFYDRAALSALLSREAVAKDQLQNRRYLSFPALRPDLPAEICPSHNLLVRQAAALICAAHHQIV